jgi:hypothetical protein
MSGELNVPKLGLDSSNRLPTHIGTRGTENLIPTVQSGYIVEGVSLPAAAPLKAVYLLDPGLPGDCTISYPSGKAAVALGATACVITNTLVTTATMCFITPLLIDSSIAKYKVVCTADTITVTVDAAANADWPFYFFIIQQVAP